MATLLFQNMHWYKVTIDTAGQYDLRNSLNKGYHFNHKATKKHPGDADYVVGGMGWEVRKSPTANPRYTRTLRDHVMVYTSDQEHVNGVYVSNGVLEAFGLHVRSCDAPHLRIGQATFYKLTAELEQDMEYHVGYERRSERERFVQERNAGIWNALLGLAQDYAVEPWKVH